MSLKPEFDRIPAAAKIVAAAAWLAIASFFFWMFDDRAAVGYGTLLGAVMGTVVAGFILLAGYVYADAARRGMPPLPWTALSLAVPNGVGFVLYFVLRKPLLRTCAGCGRGIASDAAYCPRCGHPQFPAEPILPEQ